MGGAQTFALLLSLLKNSFVGQRTKPTEELPINLSSPFLLPIKSTLLLALLTGLRRSIFFLWVGTTLALCANKCSYDVTVLTRLGRSKLLNILRTFLAYSVGFTFLLELRSAIGAFYNWVSNSALLTQLLALGELLERVPLVTLGTGVQSRGHPPPPALASLRKRGGKKDEKLPDRSGSHHRINRRGRESGRPLSGVNHKICPCPALRCALLPARAFPFFLLFLESAARPSPLFYLFFSFFCVWRPPVCFLLRVTQSKLWERRRWLPASLLSLSPGKLLPSSA